MKLVLIAAVARNGVIGHDNRLLWHLPEDMKFFKNATLGHPVLMGRKTWDSIPARFRPLAQRHNIVLTRQADWQAEGAQVAHTLDDALRQAREAIATDKRMSEPAFLIGGAQLYAQALPYANLLMLTEIEHDFDGDAQFPTWSRSAFKEISREDHRASAANGFNFSFVTYQLNPPSNSPSDAQPCTA